MSHFSGRFDWKRLLTRALAVVGLLLLVLTWRLDQFARTAYDSGWTARSIGVTHCTDCRLPGSGWVGFHVAFGMLGILLLVGAVFVWRRRVLPGAATPLVRLCRIAAGLAVVGELVAAFLRGRADTDHGASLVRLAFAADAAALLLVLIMVLAIAASSEWGAASVHGRRFVQRHAVNLVGVLVLALVLDVVSQTNGQAIDSIRGWVVGDARGMTRLSFGLATTLLLALVVYESSIRLTLARAASQTGPAAAAEPAVPARSWFVGGGVLLAVGAAGGLLLPIGFGVAVLGGILLLLGLFELAGVGDRAEPQPAVAAPSYESATSENLAVVPLLAVAVVGFAATVDAALSDGTAPRLHSLLVLAPSLVLAAGAIVMTSLDIAPPIDVRPYSWAVVAWRWGGSFVVVAVLLVGLLLANSERLAAGVGFVVLLGVALYAWMLFHASAELVYRHSALLVLLPLTIWSGVFVAVAVHWNVFHVANVLGVYALVNLGVASILTALHYVVLASLRRPSPKFFAALGMQQVPLLTVLAVWWIGAGLAFPPHSLHDARIVEHSASTGPPTVSTAFDSWRSAQGPAWASSSAADPPLPLVLVAAHGGGIRAAYWTALVLDCVVGAQSDETAAENYEDTCTNPERRRSPDARRAAARRIFLTSGVSGGAVGLYAYARQLLEEGDLTDGWVDRRLGGDFAAATIGWAIFHDLPNHLLGVHPDTGGDCEGLHLHSQCFAQDRAAVLEDTFDRRFDGNDAYVRATWDQRSSSIGEERARAQLVPLVVDNSTVVGGNTRAVTSALELSNWPLGETSEVTKSNVVDEHPLAGTAQVLSALCTANDMRLSTAALLASRFPYVNPSGRVNGACKPHASSSTGQPCARPEIDCEMAMVDGGYTDNSGLFTIDALIPALKRLIEESNSSHPKRRKIALVVVEIDNHYQATLREPPAAKGRASETLAPLTTVLGAHGALETFARASAYRMLPDTCVSTIAPALHPGLAAPLGWELSRETRHDLQAGLVKDSDKPRKERPIQLVKRLQRWLGVLAPRDDLESCVPEDPPLPGSARPRSP